MDRKTKEVYGNKPKLDRATKRKLKRKIDKDVKAGKYDDLKSAIKQDEDKAKGGLDAGGSNYSG